jgi:hypothetical protein
MLNHAANLVRNALFKIDQEVVLLKDMYISLDCTLKLKNRIETNEMIEMHEMSEFMTWRMVSLNMVIVTGESACWNPIL